MKPDQITQLIESILAEMEADSANKFAMMTGRVYMREAMEKAIERYESAKALEARS